jgi:hypothetical protein
MGEVRSGELDHIATLEARIAAAVAILQEPLDTRICIDSHTGRALWKANLADRALQELMSVAPDTLVSPPMSPEFCGKRGPRFDGAPPTGGCVYLSNHVNVEGKERHSWQGASSSSSES